MRKILIILLLLPCLLFSQPTVTGAVGKFAHGLSITVTGTGFGVKSPAAPFFWDPGIDSVAILSRYAEALPSAAQQGSYYNTKYHTLPFRGISAPNSHITHCIAGAHATNNSSGQYAAGNNVSVLISGINSQTVPTTWNWYLQYWYRIDPGFQEVNNPEGENMKLVNLSGSSTQIYGSIPPGWGYMAYCGGTVPDVNYTGLCQFQRAGVNNDGNYSCSGALRVDHLNPINDWVKMEWYGGYDDTYDNPTWEMITYPDHARTYQNYQGYALSTYEILLGIGFPPKVSLRSVAVGGFARVPRIGNGTNAFRYMTAIYFDTTKARVVLGNNSNYDLCTIAEPQIPASWSTSSITATVNLGEFSDIGTAYLFVFDANNNHNTVGYAVTLSAPGPTSVTVPGDTIVHGNTFVVNGVGFGTKSPAAPLWWDDGEGATHGYRSLVSGELSWVTSSSLSGNNKHYNDAWPGTLTGEWDSCNVMYRHPIRSVDAPHAYSTKYIAAGHVPQDSCSGGQRARNVCFNYSDHTVHNDWFVSYYLRLDPLWPICTSCENNYKFFVWEDVAPYTAYSGSYYYDNWPGCGSNPHIGDWSSFRQSPACGRAWVAGVVYREMVANLGAPGYGYPVITYDTLALNPVYQWVKSEHIARFAGSHAEDILKHLHNNVELMDIENDLTHTATNQGQDAIGGITIGGFLRIATCANGNDILDRDAWRYFDDVYIDKTFSRVILGNASTYTACSILEPQIPSTWSATAITVKANLGALTDSIAYLYVFDSNNVCNNSGLLVSLGGEVVEPPEPPIVPDDSIQVILHKIGE